MSSSSTTRTTIRAADWIDRPRPRRRPARRPGRRRGPARRRRRRSGESLTGALPPRDAAPSPSRPEAASASRRLDRDPRRVASTTSRTIDVAVPLGALDVRHRGQRLGQEHAGPRDPLPGAPPPRSEQLGPTRPARTTAIDGLEAHRQADRGRPDADRPHAALDPGDLHRPLRRDPQALRRRPATRSSAATSPSRFSFNVKGGRCEACEGQGMLADLDARSCPTCTCRCERAAASASTARRWRSATRAVDRRRARDARRRGAAPSSTPHPPMHAGLQALNEVGLGYITLGQSSTTLSGGEAQRVKLAAELGRAAHRPHPLHPRRADHRPPLRRRRAAPPVLHRLADAGNTVVVIEHNLDVIAVRRLGHRPRPRRRRRRRSDRRGRVTSGGRTVPGKPHRNVPSAPLRRRPLQGMFRGEITTLLAEHHLAAAKKRY